MKYHLTIALRSSLVTLLAAMLGSFPGAAGAQDRLRSMPGYQQYQEMGQGARGSVRMGSLSVTWREGGKAFEYQKDGQRYVYDIAAQKATEATSPTTAPARGAGGRGAGLRGQAGRGQTTRGQGAVPPRGRQVEFALSPDGKLRAFYRDRNLHISDAAGANELAITTDGSEKGRIKYGTASWVYGEELAQRTAMWWSPDSTKLAYYRFDESRVPDYFLQLRQTQFHDTLDTEAYPKPGDPNPVVDLFIYDVRTKTSIHVDARDGKPFEDSAVGHYVYGISWSRDGSELLLHRTNRRQNTLEYAAANPQTGKCRVIFREEWPTGWVVNSPPMRFLEDGRRFILTSERSGWRNLYLHDLGGRLISPLTSHSTFEVANIVRVDEDAGLVYYMARDGDNPMKLQLHRVGLDGKGERRLTDPAFNHSVDIAPDGAHFIDVIETHDTPPATRLVDADGKVIALLASSEMTAFRERGYKTVELLTYKAADGQTDLYGMLNFPSNFDLKKKYPMLVTVYGGPATNAARETFTLPNALTEYGFLVASFDSRSAAGRGKRFLDSIYLKLGIVEIDDQAAGVKSLWGRTYLDTTRVGIFGTSYGGYASAMCLLRYPDVFAAASASSSPTDWRQYDTIYTERYMWLPTDNRSGYDAGSAMTYASNLKGRLMLYYGTADNNVHPGNSMQLIQALQRAGKSFEVQVGPDQGHSGINQQRMMEFFIENLVMTANAER